MSKFFAFTIGGALALALYYFVGGGVLMFLLGVLHGWNSKVPTMGFWTACLTALLLRFFLALILITDIKSKDSK